MFQKKEICKSLVLCSFLRIMEFSEAGYHFIIKTTRKERSFCEKSKGFKFLRRNTYESKKKR